MRFYRLKKDFWFAPANTIIIDDGQSFEVNGKLYDIRSSVANGEIALLLSCMIQNKFTSIIEEIRGGEAQNG